MTRILRTTRTILTYIVNNYSNHNHNNNNDDDDDDNNNNSNSNNNKQRMDQHTATNQPPKNKKQIDRQTNPQTMQTKQTHNETKKTEL